MRHMVLFGRGRYTYDAMTLATAKGDSFAADHVLISTMHLAQIFFQRTRADNRLVPSFIEVGDTNNALANCLVHMPWSLVTVCHV